MVKIEEEVEIVGRISTGIFNYYCPCGFYSSADFDLTITYGEPFCCMNCGQQTTRKQKSED